MSEPLPFPAEFPPEKEAEKEDANIIIKTSRTLKKNYHKKCIDNSITMKDELTGHIREYVGDVL
jgi:hypothetical protein